MAAIDLKNVLRVLRTYLTERDLTVADLTAANIDDLFSLGITKSQVETLLGQLEGSITENFVIRKSDSTDNFITSNADIEKDEYSYLQKFGDDALYSINYISFSASNKGDYLSNIKKPEYTTIDYLHDTTNGSDVKRKGLSFDANGNLYTIARRKVGTLYSNEIHKINSISTFSTLNKIMSLDNDADSNSDKENANWNSLAIDNDNTFYSIKNSSKELYRINITEKTKEVIKTLSNSDWQSLAIHPDGTLYGINNTDKKLYSINKSSGETTEIVTLSNKNWLGMTFDSDGILYATLNDGNNLNTGLLYKIILTETNGVITKEESEIDEHTASGEFNSIAFNPISYKIVQKFKNTVNETLIKSPKIYSVLNGDGDTEVAKIVVNTNEITDISSEIDTFSKAEITQKDAEVLREAKEYTNDNAGISTIADGSITTAKIKNAAVTEGKLSSAVQTKLNASAGISEGSANAKDTATLNSAKDYADTQDDSHSTDDRAYTDTEVQKAKNFTYSKADIDSKDASTLTSANTYTDDEIAKIPTPDLSAYSNTAQVDAKDQAILTAAKADTNTKLNDYDTSAESDTKNATTLSNANSHANSQDTALSNTLRAAFANADDSHSTADRAYADAQDAITLTAAKTYADGVTPDLSAYSTTAEVNAKIAEEDQKVKDASRFLLASWRNESGDPFTASTERNIASLPIATKSGSPTWETADGGYVEMSKGSSVSGIWWENNEIDFERFTLTVNINAGTVWRANEGLILFFGGSDTPANNNQFWGQSLGKFVGMFPANPASSQPNAALFTRWAGGANNRGWITQANGAPTAADWTDGEDHQLRYEIWGKTIRTYFDGRLIGTMDTPAPTGSQAITGGRFGFMVETQGTATRRLRDIFITQATIASAEPALQLPVVSDATITGRDITFKRRGAADKTLILPGGDLPSLPEYTEIDNITDSVALTNNWQEIPLKNGVNILNYDELYFRFTPASTEIGFGKREYVIRASELHTATRNAPVGLGGVNLTSGIYHTAILSYFDSSTNSVYLRELVNSEQGSEPDILRAVGILGKGYTVGQTTLLSDYSTNTEIDTKINRIKIVETKKDIFLSPVYDSDGTYKGGGVRLQTVVTKTQTPLDNPLKIPITENGEPFVPAAGMYNLIDIAVLKEDWDKTNKVEIWAAHASPAILSFASEIYQYELTSEPKTLIASGAGYRRAHISIHLNQDENSAASTTKHRIRILALDYGTNDDELYLGEVRLVFLSINSE